MHVILTHEQADFDALASLLGAYLLYEEAIPVLPRRMNRNVRAFLALYGVDLPFVDPRDLPNQPVEMVTLVDTQSLVSVKGISAETRVQVVDHHPLREGLPEEWTINTVELGATTTLLIEALREQNGGFSAIQSTLMLLGIYEDTGSLTYTRTSARDLRAAAYLMEHGANLQIAFDFLNHPLSPDQQTLFDRLIEKPDHLHIHSFTILVAYGDAQDMDEELSTLAHKLRDLLDPDALFLLVTTRSGTQIIARSTTDNIDVAAVLSNFGGGGHERAAASLIRDRDLEDVRRELIQILPEYVIPPLTVSQIMSRDPQLLSPDTPVEEAADRMRRFGHEGYPVVKEGKVIGLLTRRAVDRALTHRLNLTASSLMEAGDHSVSPSDSIDHLSRLVTETGWGQIPVIDPESRKIVGIVTRTDILKMLTPEARISGRLNLSDRLEAALPADRLSLLKAIAEVAHEQHAAFFLVGGFVRDLLLELPSQDFDLVVEGDAISLAVTLARRYGGRVTSHARFGTAKWHLDSSSPDGKACQFIVEGLRSIDLVTARTEFYTHPTALPTVERGSIKLDLHRRDFTINTLALRLDGRHYGDLHDYWGGLADLKSCIVRVLHSLSFVDDPTRILRAVRFEQRFEFKIEDRTMVLLLEARNLIERLSGDRIRHELDHILISESAPEILERLSSLFLLSAIHPYLKWDEWLNARFQILAPFSFDARSSPDFDVNDGLSTEALRFSQDYPWEVLHRLDLWGLADFESGEELKRQVAYILWMIRLSPEKVVPILKRLKLPMAIFEAIRKACDLWQESSQLVTAPISKVVAALEELPPIARFALFLAVDESELRQLLWDYNIRWQYVKPTLDGKDLIARGLPPGPEYSRILRALRSAWLDGMVTTPHEEQALLEELLPQ